MGESIGSKSAKLTGFNSNFLKLLVNLQRTYFIDNWRVRLRPFAVDEWSKFSKLFPHKIIFIIGAKNQKII